MDGARPLRSWMSFRLARISSSSSVSRLPMPRSFSTSPSSPCEPGKHRDRGRSDRAIRHGPRVTVNSVRLISCPRNRSATASMAAVLVVEVGLKMEFHRPSLQAAHVGDAVLVQDRGDVGLGDVVGEAAILEHARWCRRRAPAPCATRRSRRQRLDHLLRQSVGKAGDQRAAADGMDGLARDRLRLDRHAEIEAELEQQLVEDVLLACGLARGARRSSAGCFRGRPRPAPTRGCSDDASLKTRKPRSPANERSCSALELSSGARRRSLVSSAMFQRLAD